MLPTRPEPYPVSAAFGRIAVSALLMMACAAVAGLTVHREHVPGLRAVTTPIRVPLDGAERATLNVNAGAADLILNAGMNADPTMLLTGRAQHREGMPLTVKASPMGPAISSTVNLARASVPSTSFGNAGINLGFTPGYAVRAAVTPAANIALSTTTDMGDQNLNLARVRLTGLSASTQNGDLKVTLPPTRSGTMRLRTGLGDLTVAAPAASAGHTTLDARTTHGELEASLDGRTRATFATTSGDLRLSVRARTRGTLTAQTSHGDINVTLPAGLRVRVTAHTRMGDLTLPKHLQRQGDVYTSAGGAPDLTLTLDAHTGDIRVTTEGAQP